MTCDEYFDHLTSALPPTAGDLPAVHWAGCPRCRSLAETLEPALALFRAAAAEPRADEVSHGCLDDDLPVWLLAAENEPESEQAVEARPRPVADLSAPCAAKSPRQSLAWPVLAAMLIGLLVGGAVWGVGVVNQRGVLRHGTGDWPSLAAIPLTPACLLPNSSSVVAPPSGQASPTSLAQADLANLKCCTSCHAAGRQAAKACKAQLLAVSCQACHRP